MLYSAIKGMWCISANGSIESPQTVHHWAFWKVTTKMADQDVKESHEKTVNLERFGGGTKINYFNVLMNIPVNGRN